MKQSLENDMLLVEIEDKGAELCRIYDKEKGREVLWNGDPAFWGRRAPVLFPNVGRHWQDQYRVNGKRFPSSQHGFARDMAFVCVEKTDREVVHQLKSDDVTRKKYPFDFVLRIRHTLKDRELTVCWEVENPGDDTMYFTIGGHPAFRVPVENPAAEAEGYENYRLYFPGKTALTYLLIARDGSGTVEADQPHTLMLQDGSVSLGQLKDRDQVLAEHFFDLDALVFDGGQISEAQILLPDGTAYLKLHAQGFPCFRIWAAPRAPFVCLEPWMGRADDKGFTGPLDQKPYINALAKDALFSKSYTIEIC